MGRETVGISMAEPLQYLLIPVRINALEKVSFSGAQNHQASG